MNLLTSLLNILTRFGRNYRALQESGLFDRAYYLQRYPDVRRQGIDPIVHYIRSGSRELRCPNPLFLPDHYRSQLPDHQERERNDLLDYIRSGEKHGYSPHPLFDPLFYADRAGLRPEEVERTLLFHYLSGGYKAYSPHPLFNNEFLQRQLREYNDIPDGVNLLLLYLHEEGVWDMSPHPLFSPGFYQIQLPPQAQTNREAPLLHYLHNWKSIGADPYPLFASTWYARSISSAEQNSMSPLQHYLEYGILEGREPVPLEPARKQHQSVSFLIVMAISSAGPFAVQCIKRIRRICGQYEIVICLRQAAGTDEAIQTLLAENPAVRVMHIGEDGRLTEQLKEQIATSDCSHALIVRQPVLFGTNLLSMFSHFVASDPGYDLLYCDNWVLVEGKRERLEARPSWSPFNAESHGCIGDLFGIKRERLLANNLYVDGASGLWDPAVLFGPGRESLRVCHIPYALYALPKLCTLPVLIRERDAGEVGKTVIHSRNVTITGIAVVPTEGSIGLPYLDAVRNVASFYDEFLVCCLADQLSYLTEALQEMPTVRAVPTEGKSSSLSVFFNCGAQTASGNWISFVTNPRYWISGECVTRLRLELIKRDGLKLVGIRERDNNDFSWERQLREFPESFQFELGRHLGFSEDHARQETIIREVPLVGLNGLTVRRESFYTLGGFDTLYKQNYIDFDFCMKFAAEGERVVEVVLPRDTVSSASLVDDRVATDPVDFHLFMDMWGLALKEKLFPETGIFCPLDIDNRYTFRRCFYPNRW